jgi:hypothetical protein
MSKRFRRHLSGSAFVRFEKAQARRASRRGGAKRAIEVGLEEAREYLPTVEWGTTLSLFLALRVAQIVEDLKAAEAYYAHFGEGSRWTEEDFIVMAEKEVRYG